MSEVQQQDKKKRGKRWAWLATVMAAAAMLVATLGAQPAQAATYSDCHTHWPPFETQAVTCISVDSEFGYIKTIRASIGNFARTENGGVTGHFEFYGDNPQRTFYNSPDYWVSASSGDVEWWDAWRYQNGPAWWCIKFWEKKGGGYDDYGATCVYIDGSQA